MKFRTKISAANLVRITMSVAYLFGVLCSIHIAWFIAAVLYVEAIIYIGTREAKRKGEG